MTHFTVLVIGDNPDEQLAPYQENNMGDCPAEYLKFSDKEAEYLDSYNEGIEGEAVWIPNFYLPLEDSMREAFDMSGHLTVSGLAIDSYISEDITAGSKCSISTIEGNRHEDTGIYGVVKFWEHDKANDEYHFEIDKTAPPEIVPYKINYASFEDYMEDYHGYEKDSETGKYGYWANPNAKWDWYVIGGRFAGFFTLKNGEKDDFALKRDIDYEAMLASKVDNLTGNYHEAMDKISSGSEVGMIKFMYNLDPDMTLEQYISQNNNIETFAVVKDGKWYEKGKMGFWATVTDEKSPEDWSNAFDSILKEIPEDTPISLYDCHI